MPEPEALLSGHPFFRDLSEEHLRLMSAHTTFASFAPGEFLIREGEPADDFHVLLSGRVTLEIAAGRPLTIQTLGAGDLLGFSWLVPPHRWSFSARALEHTETMRLSGTDLRMAAETDHSLGYTLMVRFSQVMLRRLQAARIQLLDLYAHHDEVATHG